MRRETATPSTWRAPPQPSPASGRGAILPGHAHDRHAAPRPAARRAVRLFALGQSLMFGVMRLTNTAQGDFIVLAAFAAIAIAGLRPRASGRDRAAAVAGRLRLRLRAAARGAQWHARADPLPSLVVTFGLAIVIQNVSARTLLRPIRARSTPTASTRAASRSAAALRSACCRSRSSPSRCCATAALQGAVRPHDDGPLPSAP